MQKRLVGLFFPLFPGWVAQAVWGAYNTDTSTSFRRNVGSISIAETVHFSGAVSSLSPSILHARGTRDVSLVPADVADFAVCNTSSVGDAIPTSPDLRSLLETGLTVNKGFTETKNVTPASSA